MYRLAQVIGLLLVLVPGLTQCSRPAAKKQSGAKKAGAVLSGPTDPAGAQSLEPPKVTLPKHECKASPECLRAGFCTQHAGSCVVKSDTDCESAKVCKHDGKCSAQKGACVVGDQDDCTQSRRCKHAGECLYKKGECVTGKKPPR